MTDSSFYDKFLSYPTIAAISASVCEAKKDVDTGFTTLPRKPLANLS